MWSSAKTLESILGASMGQEANELIIKLGPYADPEMIVKTICFKLNEVHPMPMYLAFKEALAKRRVSREQAIREAIEKRELRIQIPPFISPINIVFFHVGKGCLKTPIYPIQQ